MIRDPLDTLLSCFKNKFDDIGLEWTLDVKDLVLQYVLYLQYVHQYRRLLPKRVLEIRYVISDDISSILFDMICILSLIDMRD